MYIKVKVITNQKTSFLAEKTSDSFEALVRAKPERGEANKEVLRLLRRQFPKAKEIRLISGHTSPGKIFSIDTEVI